jgi:hypothetical protein
MDCKRRQAVFVEIDSDKTRIRIRRVEQNSKELSKTATEKKVRQNFELLNAVQ